MNWKQKLKSLPISWFTLAMIGIFLFSLILRFWNLSQFNKLVFDEVYYAKFSNNYLTGTHFFNAHPPLSQYIIAIGIWIGSHFPATPDTMNNLTGSLRSTFSYRWLNAFTGSFIPLLIGGIAYQLTYRRSYALIATFLTALDGLFLVESRYALNNIYLVILGLLGQLFFLLALRHQKSQFCLLTFAGIFLGSSACIKWNGLGFLLGIYLVIIVAWTIKLFKIFLNDSATEADHNLFIYPQISLDNITEINLRKIIFNLGIIPIVTYSLLWIPHLIMNPEYGFWRMQEEILSFHERIGSGSKVHPYCSRWYSWLIMWRPIAYFYQKVEQGNTIVAADQKSIVYDVHAMANPILLWFSTIAILLLFWLLIRQFLGKKQLNQLPSSQIWIFTYLICNYVANLLPWIKVSRCTFFYHYMESYVFAILALAWIISACLQSHISTYRYLGFSIIILIIAAFIFWLPIYLGLPLSPEGYRIRMLLASWV